MNPFLSWSQKLQVTLTRYGWYAEAATGSVEELLSFIEQVALYGHTVTLEASIDDDDCRYAILELSGFTVNFPLTGDLSGIETKLAEAIENGQVEAEWRREIRHEQMMLGEY